MLNKSLKIVWELQQWAQTQWKFFRQTNKNVHWNVRLSSPSRIILLPRTKLRLSFYGNFFFFFFYMKLCCFLYFYYFPFFYIYISVYDRVKCFFHVSPHSEAGRNEQFNNLNKCNNRSTTSHDAHNQVRSWRNIFMKFPQLSGYGLCWMLCMFSVRNLRATRTTDQLRGVLNVSEFQFK